MIMKGTERAANCYDCHGNITSFQVKDTKSMTHVSNISKTAIDATPILNLSNNMHWGQPLREGNSAEAFMEKQGR